MSLGHSGLDDFFTGYGGVSSYHPEIFEEVLKKSIVTATFERAIDKHYFSEQQDYHPSCGIEHGGYGELIILNMIIRETRTIRLYEQLLVPKILLSIIKRRKEV